MSENRRSTRHDVDLPVTLVIGDDTFETVIKNLSVGGALIDHTERIPVATRVAVTFKLPSVEDAVKVGATVRWVAGTALGVQFDGLRAREVWSLNKYFETLEE